MAQPLGRFLVYFAEQGLATFRAEVFRWNFREVLEKISGAGAMVLQAEDAGRIDGQLVEGDYLDRLFQCGTANHVFFATTADVAFRDDEATVREKKTEFLWNSGNFFKAAVLTYAAGGQQPIWPGLSPKQETEGDGGRQGQGRTG